MFKSYETTYKVINNKEVIVTAQARICGCIDYGSVTRETYVLYNNVWRNILTGELADLELQLSLDEEVDKWEFRMAYPKRA
jgi:hypothetical protein